MSTSETKGHETPGAQGAQSPTEESAKTSVVEVVATQVTGWVLVQIILHFTNILQSQDVLIIPANYQLPVTSQRCQTNNFLVQEVKFFSSVFSPFPFLINIFVYFYLKSANNLYLIKCLQILFLR